MAQLILVALMAIAIWVGKRQLSRLTPSQKAAWRKKLPLIIVLLIILVLTAAGRLHWLGLGLAAALFAVKFLITALTRGWPLWRMYRKLRGNGGVSRMETASLRMMIDIDRGHMDGEVLDGPFTGRALSSLSSEELEELKEWLKTREKQSTLLLQAYLLRHSHGGKQHQGGGSDENVATSEPLSEQEAWQILGLKPGASQEEIVKAHRTLIQRLHPDRGGNDYLAAKVNAARDCLLG